MSHRRTLRDFKRTYDGAELIRLPTADISIGSLVWDALIGKPTFDKSGMSNHFLRVLNREDNPEIRISDEEHDRYQKYIKALPMKAAHFPDIELDVETAVGFNLNIIGKIDAELKFEHKREVSFAFTNVKMQSMDRKIDNYFHAKLEAYRANKWRDYDERIRRTHMVVALYYGEVVIEANYDRKFEIEAGISKSDVKAADVETLHDDGHTISIKYANPELPFAMDIDLMKKM